MLLEDVPNMLQFENLNTNLDSIFTQNEDEGISKIVLTEDLIL